MDNTIINNDTTAQTLITIKVDNKNINHAALNKFLIELEQLQQKHSIISAKEGVVYGR
ncbi:hypothetical protein [Clostridium tagluense]|uniref:Uncharacterized protein n=1 Tax=Clostridium tagluense TaxID=360422 RepID=A0A401ULQ0_9CLOT|nr:hypothetical protein [Clostridium tagluense]GCD10455.1 hypothetical protein Ctaglu_20780 [Clostridium tagluense]